MTRAYKPCNELSSTDAAYLAGLVDADGHIAIYGSGRAPRVVMTVSNTHVPVLVWIRDTTGVGSVIAQHKEREGYKATYQWVTGGPAGVSVLRVIRPFMIVKAERADLAIEYQDFLEVPENRVDLDQRLMYRGKMMQLNRRGPVHE